MKNILQKTLWLFALLFPVALYAQKPNVIYILTDQWRASAFGYAGDSNVQTPHIDQFANEAVNFVNAITVAC